MSNTDTATNKLAGRPQVAAILGVSRQRVQVIESQPGFPKPLDVLEGRPIWRRSAVDRYKAKREAKAAA